MPDSARLPDLDSAHACISYVLQHIKFTLMQPWLLRRKHSPKLCQSTAITNVFDLMIHYWPSLHAFRCHGTMPGVLALIRMKWLSLVGILNAYHTHPA